MKVGWKVIFVHSNPTGILLRKGSPQRILVLFLESLLSKGSTNEQVEYRAGHLAHTPKANSASRLICSFSSARLDTSRGDKDLSVLPAKTIEKWVDPLSARGRTL